MLKKEFFIISKERFKFTQNKKEADKFLKPGTIVKCYENGRHISSYGCVSKFEVKNNHLKI